ncbi:Tungstate uptake system permease protein TupB [bioreactor metagenome]|uniref:Tungstate uptake system permease protein TupB n=1 Tax=bioreactor metagenome TaxID=1076179 RepID=A0A645GBS2_9ZZZZ
MLFTTEGIALGQIVLGLPIVVALTASAIEGLEVQLRQTLLTLGTTKRQLTLSTLWEARYAVIVAAITAYSRIISEVGVSMMLGGNIKWHTRTITTAIALETGKGEFAMGIALGLVLLSLVLVVNLMLAEFKRRSAA